MDRQAFFLAKINMVAGYAEEQSGAREVVLALHTQQI